MEAPTENGKKHDDNDELLVTCDVVVVAWLVWFVLVLDIQPVWVDAFVPSILLLLVIVVLVASLDVTHKDMDSVTVAIYKSICSGIASTVYGDAVNGS
jgi:hypothetical protein